MRSSSTSDIASRIRIRRAHADDAVVLSEFGERIFRETFEAANDPRDLAAYLADAFGADRQRAEIAEADGIVLLAEEIAGSDRSAARDGSAGSSGSDGSAGSDGSNVVTPLAGYSHLTASEPPDSVRGAHPLELKRFYIDRKWQGAGLAQFLMRATLDAATAAGARTLWLGVWEHNPRAIAFYRKFEFVEVGAHDFMLGRDRQTDLIMARLLTTDAR